MTEWQPIETAPKDGTVFLAYWEPPRNFPYKDKYHVCHYAHGVIWPGWINTPDDLPTHWMPLPPPPKKGDK